jgi:hypothetical protein
MGYRSDVAVSMFRKDFDRLVEFSKEEEVLKDLIKYADSIKETTDNVVVIKWDSIKWYEEFPEIQALNELENYVKCQPFPNYAEGSKNVGSPSRATFIRKEKY